MSASALLPAAVRRTDDVLAQADLAEAAIPAAIEAGAVDDLVTLVSRADAQKLYEQSQQHTAEALRLTRLKLRCEAALGLLLWSQGRHGTQTRVSWWRAASVISAAGGDPHGLPFASRKVGRRARRRLWVTRQPKATGSRWDEAQVRLYALVSEIDALAPNNSAYHADLWDHLEAVRAFVLRQQRRKETAA